MLAGDTDLLTQHYIAVRRQGPIATVTPTIGRTKDDATKLWHFVDLEITDPEIMEEGGAA
jgi:hypothetical protein